MRRLSSIVLVLVTVMSFVGLSKPTTAAETGNLDRLRHKALELVIDAALIVLILDHAA